MSILKTEYIQYSKKLAISGIAQWVFIVAFVLLIIILADLNAQEADVINSIVTWSATLAGVIITGYMGNSSIEKYANRKFTLAKSITADEETESNG